MRKTIGLLLLVLAVLAAGVSCGEKEKQTGLSGDYSFGGSTTVDPIITAAIEEWKAIHPDVHISYEGVGSSNGVKGVIDDTYSLGAASRDLKDSEVEKGVKSIAVALDALAPVVNQDTVTVSDLTIEQLAKIYAGEITNWSEVGGPDAAIVAFMRDEASGTYESWESLILGKEYQYADDLNVVTSNGDMAAKVGDTPYSIGYVGLGFTTEPGLKILMVSGVEPNVENVYDESYPVKRRLNVVYTGVLTGVEKDFVDYLLGVDGQAIVESIGYIKIPK